MSIYNEAAEFKGPVTTKWLNLNTSPGTVSHSEGIMYYNSTYNTFNLYNDDTTLDLSIGHQTVVKVYNNTGVALPGGKVISVDGVDGSGFGYAVLADATDDALRNATTGLVFADIANGSYGYVVMQGILRDVDTSSIAEGLPVWLNTAEPGGLTSTEPTDDIVSIGTVLTSHATTGTILINIKIAGSGGSIWYNEPLPPAAYPSYVGPRLMTNEVTNGIWIQADVNEATGYAITNEHAGNAAYAGIDLTTDTSGNIGGGIYAFGTGYYVSRLQSTTAMWSTTDYEILTARENTEFRIRLGNKPTDSFDDADTDEVFKIESDFQTSFPELTTALINTKGDQSAVHKKYVDDSITAGVLNIYNVDGTITAERTVTVHDDGLTFNSSGSSELYIDTDSISIDAQSFGIADTNGSGINAAGGELELVGTYGSIYLRPGDGGAFDTIVDGQVWTAVGTGGEGRWITPSATIVGITGTKAEFNTALTDGSFVFVGDNVSVLTNDAGYITSSSLHDAVTLSGTGTYLTLVGQDIQVDPITESDISDLQAYLLAADLTGYVQTIDIDTFAELDAIVADESLIKNTGTPVANQLAKWTAANTLQGIPDITLTATTLTIDVAEFGNSTFSMTNTGVVSLYGATSMLLKSDGVTIQDVGAANMAIFTSGTSVSLYNELILPDYGGGAYLDAGKEEYVLSVHANGNVIETAFSDFQLVADLDDYLRADVADVKTAGNLTFNDNVYAIFGTGGDSGIHSNGTNTAWQLVVGDLLIQDSVTTRFTFGRTTGNFTANGFVQALTGVHTYANTKVTLDTNEDAFSFIINDWSDAGYGFGAGSTIYATYADAGHHFINGEDDGYDDVYARTFHIQNGGKLNFISEFGSIEEDTNNSYGFGANEIVFASEGDGNGFHFIEGETYGYQDVTAGAFITDGGASTQVVLGDGTLGTISSLSVGDADTLDSLDSLQFLRSDVDDDMVGIIYLKASTNNKLVVGSNNWFTMADRSGYAKLLWFADYENATDLYGRHPSINPYEITGISSGLNFNFYTNTGDDTILGSEITALKVRTTGIESIAITAAGAVTGNTIVKASATSDDILLGDGTTTSLALLATSADLSSYLLNTTDTLAGDLTVTGDIIAGEGRFGTGTIGYGVGTIEMRSTNGLAPYIQFTEDGAGFRGQIGFEAGSNDFVIKSGGSGIGSGTLRLSLSNTGDLDITGELTSVGIYSTDAIESEYSNTTVYGATGTHAYTESAIDQVQLINTDNTQGESFTSLYFRHAGDGGNAAGRMVLTNGNAADSQFRWLLRDSAHTSYTEEKMVLTGEGDLSITGSLFINDSESVTLGTGADMEMFWGGSNGYIDMNSGNLYIRETGLTTTFTFAQNGDFTATGDLRMSNNATYLYADTSAGTATRIHGINGSDVEYIGSIDANVVSTLIGTTTDTLALRTNSTNALYINSSQDIGIGTTSPDGTVHIMTASAGSVTANASADDLVVEGSTDTGINILSPDASISTLRFGSPSDNSGVNIAWRYTDLEFILGTSTSGGEINIKSGNSVNAMYIDSSQNIGIGTTTPETPLHLYVDSSTIDSTAGMLIEQDGSGDATLSWVITGATTWNAGIDNSSADSWALSSSSGGLGSSKRISVLTGGNVGIGLSTPISRFHVYQSTTATNDTVGVTIENASTGDAQLQLLRGTTRWVMGASNGDTDLKWKAAVNLDTSPLMTLDTSGNLTANNFILSSDKRLKKNIKNVDADNHVNAQWKTFEMKNSKQKRYGVIAQELEKTNPEFVRVKDDGMKSVAYIDLLIAKIAELEARLEKGGL